ncbi:hypothetical protein Syun_001488 [Stephania yunnanensis]|uniref:Uncharacterized protein n=1 Tax=Stephania yunnanensis TaxID=152371 RepID=A0AAP0LDY8_9MAGN
MGLITLKSLLIITIISVVLAVGDTKPADGELVNVAKLDMFVNKLPDIPKIYGFEMKNGVHVSKSLEIGMFMKRWVRIYSKPLSLFNLLFYVSFFFLEPMKG